MYRKAFWILIFVLILLASVVVPAQAQPTSRVIPFTGSITGQPDGPVNLRFRLYAESMGGTSCFQEMQRVEVLAEFFAVLIGAGTPGGIPLSPCFTENTSLWIAFALEENPNTELADRTAINAVGYAYKALQADQAGVATNAMQLGGVPPSGFLPTTGGNVSGSAATSTLTVTNTNTSSGAGLTAESRSAQGTAALFTNSGGGDLLRGSNRSGVTVFRLSNDGTASVAALTANGTISAGTQYNIQGERVLSIPEPANTFLGVGAGRSNTTGDHNAFFGMEAGRNNTEGYGNSFFGPHAGYNTTTGRHNAFFGISAGFDNTAGAFNAFFGAFAGAENTAGVNNAFFGREAGFSNTMGSNNAFFGASAGQSNTTGSNNTFIGANSSIGVGSINNATAIGANVVVNQSNSVVLGNNANVGIGTSAPRAKLHVQDGNVLVGAPGMGIILRSPNGVTCRLLAIDNAGSLVLTPTTCP